MSTDILREAKFRYYELLRTPSNSPPLIQSHSTISFIRFRAACPEQFGAV
ncbi:unnamed protein product [Arabidopsis lyrata]|uniref:Expressed protein n=1 Tax=Arabidopsis lyrata subsp. lyrata TaxID=81972 RepID=D7KMJ3_ARALL|nr:expressed protein [Arabidopsis lyrata subsp. lyrata]CAH8253243.1 unnamed protein product [Arabidopsis lyrata]